MCNTVLIENAHLFVKSRPNLSGIDYGEQDYLRSIRSSIHALWDGSIDVFTFIDSMVSAIDRSFHRAWYEGIAEYGFKPDEMTPEEVTRLGEEINGQIPYIVPFAQAIQRSTKALGGKIAPFYFRAEMWGNRYGAVKSIARQSVAGDGKILWQWNPLKEHCPDCARLNGRVYRASTWRKYNIEPRSRLLACEGYKCGCTFVPTTERCTPGRPPNIAGI